jgi:hypothetical protein
MINEDQLEQPSTGWFPESDWETDVGLSIEHNGVSSSHEAPVLIFETPYRQSEILFKLDPDAYRAALTDYEQAGTEPET